MERRGKSSPARQATVCKCKPYPMQHRMQSGFSPAFARRFSAGGWRQAAMLVRDRWQSRLCRTEPGLQVSPSKRKRSPSRPFSFARRESFGVRFIAVYSSVAVRGARRAALRSRACIRRSHAAPSPRLHQSPHRTHPLVCRPTPSPQPHRPPHAARTYRAAPRSHRAHSAVPARSPRQSFEPRAYYSLQSISNFDVSLPNVSKRCEGATVPAAGGYNFPKLGKHFKL